MKNNHQSILFLLISIFIFNSLSCHQEQNQAVEKFNNFVFRNLEQEVALDPNSVIEFTKPIVDAANGEFSERDRVVALYNEGTACLVSALTLREQLKNIPPTQSSDTRRQYEQLNRFAVNSTLAFHEMSRLLTFQHLNLSASFKKNILQNGQLAHQLLEQLKNEMQQQKAQNQNSENSDASEQNHSNPQKGEKGQQNQENRQNQSENQSQSQFQNEQKNSSEKDSDSQKSNQANSQSLSKESLEELKNQYQKKEAQQPEMQLQNEGLEQKEMEESKENKLSQESLQILQEEQLRREQEAQQRPLQGDDYHVEKDW